MEWKDIINILAIFIGPVLAVIITIRYQRRYENLQSKRNLFKTLVAYRLQFPITSEFVSSLNQIDIVFYDEKNVIDAWRRCFDSLSADSDWETKKNSVVDLLHEMGQSLGYKPVRQTVYLQPYAPQQFANDNQRKLDLETNLLRVLKNSHSFDQNLPASEVISE